MVILIRNQCKIHQLNILTRFQWFTHFNKSSWWHCVSQYHSDRGAFGYNPSITKSKRASLFKVDTDTLECQNSSSNVYRFINAYKKYGHLKADWNPLSENQRHVPELDASRYGISGSTVSTKGLLRNGEDNHSVKDLEDYLMAVYCGRLSSEFMYLPTMEEREWFANAMEESHSDNLSTEDKIIIGSDLLKSQAWDRFMGVKFQSLKRYGAEGAETLVPLFRELFKQLSKDGVEEAIVGKCHRGRINLLTGLLDVAPEVIFHKVKGNSEYPDGTQGLGDVLSHFISSVNLDFGFEKPIHVTMVYNPSHLEAVDPVACGKARGRQRRLRDGNYSQSGHTDGRKVACVQVHGDAALSAQGIVQETLAMSEVPHFDIGGSVHVCVNNQVGYTTPGSRGRSTPYATDVAKMVSLPVIRVNGDDPEAVVKGVRLAVAYNSSFRRDVFLDFICWRRWGHNELDDPRFTNPGMYKVIDQRRSVPDLYAESLVKDGLWTDDEMKAVTSSYTQELNRKLKMSDEYEPQVGHLLKHWTGMVEAPDSIEVWDTGVDMSLLKYLGAKSVEIPQDFNLHPQLQKSHVTARLEKLQSGANVDWATGEILAIASLIHQGYDVRLCGQDVGRGTFSQRHCMVVDQSTDEIYIPLNHMADDQQNHLEVANSILSEEAVLGFEYGVSIDSPKVLCIWEAQFGDFFNGAQTIIDTFLSCGEEKWLHQSGLVMLLPHGYDGAGPEHSSCRFERFLQMSNSKEDTPDSERVNWNVIFPTTSAQIFHALRKQMVRNYRKPLIVVGPKSILRLPAAFSPLTDMAPGTHYQNVIGDPDVDPQHVSRVIFVSGKHFYLLKSEREKLNRKDTAIVRIETLCPFPTPEINQIVAKYKKAKEFVWAQEEHRNMGGWSFVEPRFRNLCGTQLKYAGRDESGTVAVAIGKIHKEQCDRLLKLAFPS